MMASLMGSDGKPWKNWYHIFRQSHVYTYMLYISIYPSFYGINYCESSDNKKNIIGILGSHF